MGPSRAQPAAVDQQTSTATITLPWAAATDLQHQDLLISGDWQEVLAAAVGSTEIYKVQRNLVPSLTQTNR